MHEGSITASIIETVLDTLAAEKIDGRVSKVHITVGVCQGLVPESMQMFYDMEKPDTVLADSELEVSVQGMVARCPACTTEHELDIPVMFCPDCGESMELIKGDEIIINDIEVDYDEHSGQP